MKRIPTALLLLSLSTIPQTYADDHNAALLVSAKQATTAAIEQIYSAIGQIQPARTVHASSQFAGRIIEVLSSAGDRVNKNQTLARIRSSQDEVQTPEIMSGMSGHRVIADISGRVIEQLKGFGDVIAAGDTLFTIVQETSPHISIQLPVDYAPLINDNTRVRYHINDQLIEKSLIRVVPYDTQSNGSMLIEAPAAQGQWVTGSFVPVDVVLQRHTQNLVIPRSAIAYADDKPFVLVIEKNKAVQKFVTPGIETRTQVEIIDGLTPDSNVITRGNYNLAPGSTVKVKPGA